MSVFNVILVGAGEINFGSVEGPWNHSIRLERKLDARLRVVALIDIDQQRAEAALQSKLNSVASQAYRNTRIFASIQDATSLQPQYHPQLVIVGAPPFVRGSDQVGQDLELQIIRHFPDAALFVEKPVTSGPAEYAWRVAERLAAANTLVSVGYVLRYLKAVKKVKEIIEQNNLVVMGTNARYVMAYEYAWKLPWWDKTRCGGPIIEQGTHFCDLLRYFGGQVHLPSVTAHTVEHFEEPGNLSAKRFDEDLIPESNRIPRLTCATWKYVNGAVGSMMHVIALHGNTYDTELDIYADGYRLKLIDPYNFPTLSVRRPGAAIEEIYKFEGDDAFYTEISEFIDVIDSEQQSAKSKILSLYEDAIATFEFTVKIREESDKFAQTLRPVI